VIQGTLVVIQGTLVVIQPRSFHPHPTSAQIIKVKVHPTSSIFGEGESVQLPYDSVPLGGDTRVSGESIQRNGIEMRGGVKGINKGGYIDTSGIWCVGFNISGSRV
jgi:hypothetical protein